ncbi:MAG: hypothetical protein B6D62_02585 [Candidatus Cloacimonas sp. 4484_275]|nr:MAG: hypothetical protein B6D62_02585 [Candidatus Cloacimonas sp. 4484_275]
MISIKNRDEILKMRESNRIVALLLHEVRELIKPGISTKELDEFAEDLIRKEGGIPAFKGYQIPGLKPFPGAICASINDCIVHGIPSPEKKLRDGDIIGIDVGVLKNGFYGDGAFTYIVGSSTEKIDRLLQVTKEALNRGIAAAHGIGTQLHEDPIVPNFGRKGKGPRLREGMTIAIEPMVNIGTNRVTEKGWEFFVADGSLSAHFEHTILITDNEPEILTRI